MHPAGLVIFAVTYVLVSARRLGWLGLDRPAASMLGAVACVVFGVLAPRQAIDAIDGSTLLLLLGVMGVGAFLAIDGFFDRAERYLVTAARTPARLLAMIVWGAGLASALITNDAVCVLGAPILVRVIQTHRLPPLPFLLALATGANTGSVATLVGNPQNMLCGILGELSYGRYLLVMAPVALVALAMNNAILHALFRRALASATLTPGAPAEPLSGRARVTLAVIAATAVAYALGGDLAWTAATGFAVTMILHRRDTRQIWPRIDWSLLLFFAGLFVVVAGLEESGAPAILFERHPLGAAGDGLHGWLRLSGIFLVGSNVVSNVPFILVVREQMATLPDSEAAWALLAMASTFDGNLTLLGSVANIIVAEAGRDIGGIGFFQHLRVGLPLALLTTLAGALMLFAFRGML